MSWKRKAQADRQLPVLGEALQRRHAASASQPPPPAITSGRSPPAAARAARAAPPAPASRAPARRAAAPAAAVGVRQHVLGQHQHDRAGPALHRGVEGARDVFGQAVGVVDLADPLGHAQRAGAEHLPVVDLLEGLAVALVAGHLADEQDHRRAVLERGVHADAGVGRARAAGHEADARPAAELALRLGHEGRRRLPGGRR